MQFGELRQQRRGDAHNKVQETNSVAALERRGEGELGRAWRRYGGSAVPAEGRGGRGAARERLRRGGEGAAVPRSRRRRALGRRSGGAARAVRR
jgi:hypothetical protein